MVEYDILFIMQKLSSLDFINKEIFDTDVYSKNGKKLVSQGETVTPEILLQLYFKEIYDTVPKMGSAATINIVEQTELPQYRRKAKRKKEVFNIEHAKEVAAYSKQMGILMKLNEEEMDMLNKAAYYHDIGATLLSEEDLNTAQWREIADEAAYNYLVDEKKFSADVADIVSKCYLNYDISEFQMKRTPGYRFPLHHIICIADFYAHLSEKVSDKNKKIQTLLKIGYNKFNIYILHKFIFKLRTDSD